MKKILLALTLGLMASSASHAQTIGYSMQTVDDTYQSILRTGVEARAKELGMELLIEDAQWDIARQQSQIENFIASKVDGIIVVAVDADAGIAMSKAAAAAGIPLVFANSQPSNVNELPEKQVFVGSNQLEAGGIPAREVCRQLDGKGKVVMMMGELGSVLARERTKAAHDVFATEECKDVKIVEEQTARWSRTGALDLMTNWLSAGIEFDAVIANNDDMAMGAIQAMKTAGRSLDNVIVAGIDATPDALAAMEAGDMKVTVFQDGKKQGSASVDAMVKLLKGEPIESINFTSLELVTKDNMADYIGKN
ncbi:MAG: rhizopine-binding protein [Kaistia sp. SCN 65-12]|nr:MAG: rhizopine-binding protein [Kaistia sp. SCN 65-12]